jgi:predicted PurR-regulated permease PerM
MSVFDPRTAKVLATISAFVAVAAFIYGVRHSLVIILFAVLFAYLLEPVVLRMQTSRLARGSRSLAILETYLVIVTVLAVLGIVFGPRVAEDTRHLTQTLPSLLDRVTSGKIVWQFGSRHGWSSETQLRLEQFIATHQATILGWSGQIGTAIAKSLQNIVWVVLVPILAIFFLRDGRHLAETFLATFDEESQRRFLRGIINDLDEILARFIRAQLTLAGISLVVYCSVFALLRFPYALVLGIAAGAMEFIPVVGPLAAAVAIVSVGFLLAYPHLLMMVLFFAIWRVVLDYVISPRVMGGSLEMHPLAVIVAVLMGGELGGVLGVYLSIPMAAVIRMLWRRWQKHSAARAAMKQLSSERVRPVPTAAIKR